MVDDFDDWYSRLWESGKWVILWTQRRYWCCIVKFFFITSYRSIFRKTFSNYQSTVLWKCSLVIGLSNHCADMSTFLSAQCGIMIHVFLLSSLYWLLGMRSSSSRSSVLGEMIQLICHIFGSLRSINVTSGDKSRSSILVPVGPYNCVVLHFAPFSSLSQVFLLWKILSCCILLSQRRSLTANLHLVVNPSLNPEYYTLIIDRQRSSSPTKVYNATISLKVERLVIKKKTARNEERRIVWPNWNQDAAAEFISRRNFCTS